MSAVETPTQPLTYTPEQVARLLDICRASAYLAVKSGEIPHIKIGRRLVVPRVALARMLEQKIAAASA
jgi:excisionase family DNA binding protein